MPLIKSNNIYLGDTSVKKMYLNGALIFQNFTFIKLTAITLDNLVWATNIPASGGTATKENCTYSVTAYYSDGTTSDVTSEATITGSQVIPSTNIEEVHSAGTLTLTASYSGFSATGNVTVYQEAAEKPDFSKKPLTFIISSAGTINWMANSSLTKTIEYKLNDGEWASITSNTGESAPTIEVNSGDKIQFKGNNTQYSTSSSSYSTFSGSTAGFEIEGNIMSLINSVNFDTLTTLQDSYTFYSLFKGCTGLTSAENLVLPAMTLVNNCYDSMFNDCSSLTTASVLPSRNLAEGCYANMFRGCKSLTTAPELPATKLAKDCYSSMFSNCQSLKTAPVLPASEILHGCYWFMFSNCYSLTTVPAILATTLKSFSCYGMLGYCGKLNYIKCLATEIESNSTSNWVSGVASTGTFVKSPNMNDWTTGANGIPEGWTVENNS